MLEKRRRAGGGYTSCIRIDGVPILPPLVTDESRPELARYRQQAVAVENCLARRLLVTVAAATRGRQEAATGSSQVQEDADSGVLVSCLSSPGIAASRSVSLTDSHGRPPSSDYDGEEALFRAATMETTVVEVGETTAPSSLDPSRSQSDNSTDRAASDATVRRALAPRLTACLLDVAEFNDDRCKVLHHHGTTVLSCPRFVVDPAADSARPKTAPAPLGLEGPLTGATAAGASLEPAGDLTVPEIAAPRLVRSGSYTLENPSPVLLAHLERQSRCVLQKLESSKQGAHSSNSLSMSASEQSSYDDDFLDSVFGNSCDKNDEHPLDSTTPSWMDTCGGASRGPYAGGGGDDEEKGLAASTDDHLIHRLQQSQYDPTPPALLSPCENIRLQVRGGTTTDDTETVDDGRDGQAQGRLQLIRSLVRGARLEGDDGRTVAYCRVIELMSTEHAATQLVRQHQEQEQGMEARVRDRAASVIGAAARGYLTRRLMRTDKVQSLIQTIHDAVVCAVQLHEVQQLEEADVELHRRLIQQVSAACYAFHDVFFALPVSEQMAIIAADRKRNIEKAKRATLLHP